MEPADPLALFARWYEEALLARVPEPEAMALATATPEGRPSVRIVLYRGVSGGGIRFFTNYRSRKGDELERNPHAATTIYWAPQARQVRMEGRVERLDTAESDAYFDERPRGHQLGAHASPQSQPIADRAVLVEAQRQAEVRFAGGKVPRPAHWGGYRLVPDVIEFWTGHPDRLHDRTLWRRGADDATWQAVTLAP